MLYPEPQMPVFWDHLHHYLCDSSTLVYVEIMLELYCANKAPRELAI